MRLLLLESSNQESIAPLLRQWGYAPLTVSSPAELHLDDPAGREPILLILNSGNPANLSALLDQCANVAVGHRMLTLAIACRQDPSAICSFVDAGVDDVLTSPFDPAELQLRIRSAGYILELEHRRLYDTLTGLLNHGAIVDLLQRELQRSRRAVTPVAVAMADVDLFKQVNDTFGHQAGDAALAAVANRLLSQVRPYDFVGRYGGDEFLIVLSNCNLAQAQVISERIRAAITAVPIETPKGLVLATISIGIGVFDPAAEPDIKRLIQTADTNLYAAKNAGRNRVC